MVSLGRTLRYISGLAETHQIILKKNGLIPDRAASPVGRIIDGL